MQTILTLPPSAQLAAFSDLSQLVDYLQSNPLVLCLGQLPGARTQPGEIKALLCTYPDLESRTQAANALQRWEGAARVLYGRQIQARAAQKRLARTPLVDARSLI